jgi:predicted N-formylglutamate amidohydrolase
MLLASDEPGPVLIYRVSGASPFFLTCDHAGQCIPRALGDLGVSSSERARHIGWDIGAFGVASALSELLDATLVAQQYSRLVIDCNRPLDSEDLICTRSEATDIPGNVGLSTAERSARISAIHAPYHDAIRRLLDQRAAARQLTVYVAMHSFTPVYAGYSRPWQIGVLYGDDDRFAQPILERLRAESDLIVGENQPYRIDGKDLGIPQHALARGLLNVLIEIRQDVISTPARQRAWAGRLAPLLTTTLATLPV